MPKSSTTIWFYHYVRNSLLIFQTSTTETYNIVMLVDHPMKQLQVCKFLNRPITPELLLFLQLRQLLLPFFQLGNICRVMFLYLEENSVLSLNLLHTYFIWQCHREAKQEVDVILLSAKK
ncbi:unnamed protein product [Citrullus colocynthis]|uniref:Uncharacterized protein n=1 Tax=Citrullus colocynthis TaxID=252529 RepID=A0ABP0YJ42_9ROSI